MRAFAFTHRERDERQPTNDLRRDKEKILGGGGKCVNTLAAIPGGGGGCDEHEERGEEAVQYNSNKCRRREKRAEKTEEGRNNDHRTNQTPKHCADANSKSKQLGLVKR